MSLGHDHLSPQRQAPPALKEQQKRALPVTKYLLHVLALGLVMAGNMEQLPQKDQLLKSNSSLEPSGAASQPFPGISSGRCCLLTPVLTQHCCTHLTELLAPL